MEKIPTVFTIDRNTYRLTDEVRTPWVLSGEGEATVKWDGTSCKIEDGVLYKRFDAKKGKNPPPGWIPCQPESDGGSGSWPGWVPVDPNNPADKHAIEAFSSDLPDGTYELLGPKVQKNRYNLTKHELWRHGSQGVDVGRTKEEMKQWLENNNHEGLVFHHPDGRMAKIRRKDFGLKW